MKHYKPRYLQIYQQIRVLIKNHTYAPKQMLPTEKELAEMYEVSRPTIAKALKLLSDEKLVRRRAGYGTQVLSLSKSDLTVGLLIPRLHETEIFEPICAGITEVAARAGMKVIRPLEVHLEGGPEVLAESLVNQFIEANVDGVFFTPVEYIPHPESFNEQIIEKLQTAGIQVVLLDRDIHPWPRKTAHDLVGIDNIEAGFIVAQHLIENGCKKLAFVSIPKPAMTVKLRRVGAREALRQSGRRPGELMEMEFFPAEPWRTAERLMESGADGILCANDATAAPLLRELLDRGADIPGAIQVSGFDDVKYASLLSVPLTSYRQPCEDIGKTAAITMINRIKYPASPARRITLKGELMVRNSSRRSL